MLADWEAHSQNLGDVLLKECQQCQKRAILAAPFIKADVLRRLFGGIGNEVFITCVTRWNPHEIANGVSDIGIWLLAKSRPRTSLRLHPDLHAKYYRVDNSCMMGSANLTKSGLGWISRENLELLTSLPFSSALSFFEERLLSSSIEVDDAVYQQMLRAVEALEHEIWPMGLGAEESRLVGDLPEEPNETLAWETWLPSLREPEDLYYAYSGQLENLTNAARSQAARDLERLSIPKGLSQRTFELQVSSQLLQAPIVRRVDKLVSAPQRFGAVRDYLKTLPCAELPNFDATAAWQTLIRWMLYFLGDRYEKHVPGRYSEVFVRVSETNE